MIGRYDVLGSLKLEFESEAHEKLVRLKSLKEAKKAEFHIMNREIEQMWRTLGVKDTNPSYILSFKEKVEAAGNTSKAGLKLLKEELDRLKKMDATQGRGGGKEKGRGGKFWG